MGKNKRVQFSMMLESEKVIRATAFLIQTNGQSVASNEARTALRNLASRFNLCFEEFQRGDLRICLVSNSRQISADIASLSTILVSSNPIAKNQNDRFLEIKFRDAVVEVRTDYAGTVPAYLGLEGEMCLTNIYPIALIATKFSETSINPIGLYSLMKYGHTIGCETTSQAISLLNPNSTYSLDSVGKITSIFEHSLEKHCELSGNPRQDLRFLRDLNYELTYESLKDFDQVILPLSSGYDSRLILAAISDSTALKKKTLAVTYGPKNSMEVVSGRQLADVAGVTWKHVDLKCNYLDMKHQEYIASIFGSSLHMHGMYQLEFIDDLIKGGEVSKDSVLTSGFMTGVPAGQHVRAKRPAGSDSHFGTWFLSKFSQSKYWADRELENLFSEIFPGSVEKSNGLVDEMSLRAGGSSWRGQILFDIWTRQRNFISYYPRTLEWKLPVISPHMNPKWLDYFLSIPENLLLGRRQVVRLFRAYYPELGKIPSNSSHFSRLGSPIRAAALLTSRTLNHINVPSPLPLKYQDAPLDFDQIALIKSAGLGVYPLLELSSSVKSPALQKLLAIIQPVILEAKGGSLSSYNKLVGIQSLAWDLTRLRN